MMSKILLVLGILVVVFILLIFLFSAFAINDDEDEGR